MKTVIETKEGQKKTIPMTTMKPCQIGWCFYNGVKILVMRTASVDTFEVMDLTNFHADSCWDYAPSHLYVELITEPVTVTFIP
jgi:hypothetical protein